MHTHSKPSRKRNQRFTAFQDKLSILVKARLHSDQLLFDMLSYHQAPKKAHDYLNLLLKLAPEMNEELILKQIEQTNKDPKAMIKIRSIVNKVLLDSLFLIDYDQPNVPDIWVKEYECMKLLFQAKVLIRDGARNNAVQALEKLSKIAEEYFFTSILVDGYTLLRNHYSLLGKKNLSLKYHQKVSQLQQIQIAEHEMQNLATEVQANIIESTKNRSVFKSRFEEILVQSNTLIEENRSPQLLNQHFVIASTYLYYESKFEDILELCNKIENSYHHQENGSKAIKINEVIVFKANAYLRTGRYKEGIQYIQDSLSYFFPGSPKWITLYEEYLNIALYSEDYIKALDILRTVAPWRKDAKMTEPIKEKWMLYILFLSLVHELPAHYFFIKNFLSKKVKLIQDKLGYNVMIQLIQIIKLIEKQDLELAYIQLQALNKARNRVKSSPENKRLAILIQNLTKVLQDPFNKSKNQELGNIVTLKLKNTPPLNEYFSEFEILPYEKLWVIVAEALNKIQISKKTSLLVSKKGS